jgi:hypothetical protein
MNGRTSISAFNGRLNSEKVRAFPSLKTSAQSFVQNETDLNLAFVLSPWDHKNNALNTQEERGLSGKMNSFATRRISQLYDVWF